MATILDVAKRSGLSKTTVSRVINNHAYVSEEKRRLVLQAMEELDYYPNPAARKLRGQVTTTIGVIVPRITNPFFAYLVDAMEQAAYRKGYQVMIFQSNESRDKELSFLSMLKTKQVDGIIMTAIENEWKTVEPFLAYGPIVLCNEYKKESPVATVKMDQFKGAYMGIRHLIERGHWKIAYCTGGLFAEEGKDRDRNRGYQQALEEEGIAVNPNWIFVDRHTIEDGKQVLGSIREMRDRPTAIFTGSDEIAAGIIAEAARFGIEVPGDLAVIGFDDQPIAELLIPQLTTVRQPVGEMGRKAAEVIIGQLQNERAEAVLFELPVQVVVRQST